LQNKHRSYLQPRSKQDVGNNFAGEKAEKTVLAQNSCHYQQLYSLEIEDFLEVKETSLKSYPSHFRISSLPSPTFGPLSGWKEEYLY
jgi:hypothetical protein